MGVGVVGRKVTACHHWPQLATQIPEKVEEKNMVSNHIEDPIPVMI